ncbi:hypothetical protein [Xenorhabdus ehlersii]|uniref:Uncharacterized protein n=1 Tax=Xenorhabdus ehlersii TaxID=290111 RepID=A0A2D0IJQ9_9GAMM|nr:hypothetical protein [Xenorhabdus ehlersii]PHM21990.1 hypothetical protein Xehl_04038 [Xenorhabdus ehlersii]RKE88077.1 hypothetical protein BDE27_3638 [Xenorhabdus ehlersii]
MINVNTYIKIKEEYIDFFQYDGDIKRIDYIDGALELTINGINLIDKSMYDYIDDLWSYLSEGLALLYDNKEFKCYFPDQPIEVKFIPSKGNRVLVSVNCHSEVKTSVDKNYFLIAMRDHAKKFFKRLEYLKPSSMGECKAAMKYLEVIKL